MDDKLDRGAMLDMGIDPAIVDRLLRDTPHSGHGGRPVVSAEQMPDLLAMLDRESEWDG